MYDVLGSTKSPLIKFREIGLNIDLLTLSTYAGALHPQTALVARPVHEQREEDRPELLLALRFLNPRQIFF